MSRFFEQGRCTPGADGDEPRGRGFIALLEAFRATVGTAPGEIVGRLLEEHQAGNAVSLATLIYTGRAAGFAAPNARLKGHSPADGLDSGLEAVNELLAPLARRAHEVAAHV